MRQFHIWSGAACAILLAIQLVGCGTEPPKESAGDGGASAPSQANGEGSTKGTTGAKEYEVPVQPADLPTLDELNAKADWIDQPVKDGMKMRLEKQAGEQLLVSVPEALALRNTTPEANEKILSALGRIATDDSQVDYEAVMNRHFRRDAKSTNPLMYNMAEEGELSSLTSIAVLTLDWNLAPLAPSEVVVSWQTSKDRLVDKFVLRDDLTWSDGKPVTAHDFVFSYLTIMNPKVPIPAVRSGTDKLKWVHAYDDRTLVIFHKEALATNVWNALFPIIPKHIYEKSVADDPTLQDSDYHVNLENNPVCCGPYVITKRQRGQEYVLSRRESWYMHNGKQVRDKPYFKEVRMHVIEDLNTALRALRNGEIDDMILTPEQWVTQTTDDEFYRLNTKVSGVEWTFFAFEWNMKSPFFSDVRVRRAMSYAFDYREMQDKLNYGLYQRCNGIFHPTAWMAPKPAPPFYEQDLDKAEQLLEEAGWADHDGDGIRDKMIDGRSVPFEFSILVPPVQDRVKVCTLLKENLAQIGITCNVSLLESTVLIERLIKHEFQAAFGGWGTGSDPDTSENIWGTGEGRNFPQYSNPEVDRLYRDGRMEFDRDKRAAIYGRIAELIYADQPYTFLYFRNSFYAFNKQLRGYMFSPRDPYGYSPGFGSIYKVRN
jgi:peptide/nickel transport system substrate-binding protein